MGGGGGWKTQKLWNYRKQNVSKCLFLIRTYFGRKYKRLEHVESVFVIATYHVIKARKTYVVCVYI